MKRNFGVRLFLTLGIVLCLCLPILCGCATDKMKDVSAKANNYTIVASYDDKNHIVSATQTVTYTNKSANTFDAIKFHLYANAYRKDAKDCIVPAKYNEICYPNGESWGQIDFDTVKVDGVSVAYTIEGQDMDILSVPVGELYPDQCVTIDLTYQVQLANVLHRLGYTQNAVNLGNWYPIVCNVTNDLFDCTPYYNVGDPFVSEVANYKVAMTVPNNFVVASTGTMTETSDDEGGITYCYQAQAVRDFAMVLSPNYKKVSQQAGNTTVNYYYYADDNPQESLATAMGSFDYFCKNVGNYPYDVYNVCEVDFCYGGMEYPQLSMVTSGSHSYREAIAHETAHQWFYGVVGNNQIENAWQDEGLAEFLTYLYLDECAGVPLSQHILANTKTYTTYVDVLNHFYSEVTTGYKASCDYKNDGEYVIMTYVKGSLMFNTLYESMGRNKFLKALSRYYDNAQFTIASPEKMAECFASVGGKELSNVFVAFAEGKEIIGQVKD